MAGTGSRFYRNYRQTAHQHALLHPRELPVTRHTVIAFLLGSPVHNFAQGPNQTLQALRRTSVVDDTKVSAVMPGTGEMNSGYYTVPA